MKKNHYFCNCCRKQIQNLENLLFIDDYSLRGFCSEKCILEFYAPYIDSFYAQEAKLRNDLKIKELNSLSLEVTHEIFQDLMVAPEEIWLDRNDLGEVFYTYISYVSEHNIYAIMICCQYEGEVSFIFHKCLTTQTALVDKFRVQEKVNTSKTFKHEDADTQLDQDVELPGEVLEQLEQKKSSYLASLLQFRTDEDIDYDEFIEYEQFLSLTLEDPDEVYEMTDDDSDDISTFIKSFQFQRGTFFYVVVCWKCHIKSLGEQMLIPILSFPSIDQTLYQEFAVGERVVGQLKN